MTAQTEDAGINDQVLWTNVSQLEDCAIAVDAAYYISLFIDLAPFHEPLLSALGGLTGIQEHIESDLDAWANNRTTPFFIFDGQSVVGQDAVVCQIGKDAIAGTDKAWGLYFQSQANEAVTMFGQHRGAFPIRHLFPLLQGILKKRNLHFLVPPSNASAQLAYFDKIDSEQCAAIMGCQDLLLYPIKDNIIRSIDWDRESFSLLSKKSIMKNLNVPESMLLDAFLMNGTSFLSPFPPLRDTTITPRQPSTMLDAVNMLRTSEKSVANACASFNDILQAKDSSWQEKYRKARMSIEHFIYIDESGKVEVNQYDTLTNDNYEYLGFHLPEEMYHYLNTGLITGNILNWLCHHQIMVGPSLDGVRSDEYKHLVETQLMPLREMAVQMILPRLNRGLQYKPFTVNVWYNEKYEHTIKYQANNNNAVLSKSNTWTVDEAAVKEHFPDAKHGSIFFEVTALKNDSFAKKTISTSKVKGLESDGSIVSLVVWRFLHLRDYVESNHTLNVWGKALAASLEAIEPTVKKNPEVSGLFESVFLAFELLRFGLLNTRNQHPELSGLPMNGSDEDKSSLLLISRCAILLKLRHQANGYTGPLSKNFLAFRSLSASVREADRDLIEAIVSSLFLFAQANRDRDDYLTLGHKLPFLMDTDIALGIAVKTLLDDINPSDTAAQKATKKEEFPAKFVPYATHFNQDLEIAFDFFGAIHTGIKTLEKSEVSSADRDAWDKAAVFLKQRR